MRVLIGCERAGRIRRAFKRRWPSAAVVSADLEPAEDGLTDIERSRRNEGVHIVGDVFVTLASWPYGFDPLGRWDLFIVHPECRFLSSSGLHWNKRRPERETQTLAAVEFAVRCWTEGKKHARGVVLENPIGRLGPVMRERFGVRPQIVQPYQFGDDASKATCLYLHGVPPLVPTRYVAPRIVDGRPRWSNQTDSGQNRLAPSATRSMDRARTYPGIADALADQLGAQL